MQSEQRRTTLTGVLASCLVWIYSYVQNIVATAWQTKGKKKEQAYLRSVLCGKAEFRFALIKLQMKGS